jgi:hypothetical protein
MVGWRPARGRRALAAWWLPTIPMRILDRTWQSVHAIVRLWGSLRCFPARARAQPRQCRGARDHDPAGASLRQPRHCRGQCRQLELVAPANPAVPLTKGYVALRRSDLEEAERQVAALTAVAPYDRAARSCRPVSSWPGTSRTRHRPPAQADQPAAFGLGQPSGRSPASTSCGSNGAILPAALRAYLSWQPKDRRPGSGL